MKGRHTLLLDAANSCKLQRLVAASSSAVSQLLSVSPAQTRVMSVLSDSVRGTDA